MQKALLSKIMLLGGCALLGGCQVLGTPSLGRTNKVHEQHLADARAQVETQQGRAYLASGSNGLAIDAFNRALVFGEAPAPALNGLGVAYARLGRADLALRFFKQAVKTDPESPLFAKNLATLTNSADFTLAALRSPPSKSTIAAKPAQPSMKTGKLVRADSRQVTLVTRPASPAASTCAVTFKGMNSSACTPALPVVAARNKPPSPTAVAATEAAVSGQSGLGSRKVITIGAIDPLAARSASWPIERSLRQ